MQQSIFPLAFRLPPNYFPSISIHLTPPSVQVACSWTQASFGLNLALHSDEVHFLGALISRRSIVSLTHGTTDR